MSMKNSFETETSPEQYKSNIILSFFRHAESEKSNNEFPDKERVLTDNGRSQAKIKSTDDDISQSIAFGSPRLRSSQTAGLIMAGALDEITGNENPEELTKKLNAELNFGSKIAIDERLDFNDDFSTEMGKKLLDAYKKGEYLQFIVEKSDELAESLNDLEAETYSRMAGRVTEIVKKYIAIASRWNELVQDPTKKYEKTLKRFMGTHQGVAESFLAKVIEKTKGENERNKFVSSLNNQGFDYAEGFNLEIIDTEDGPQIKVYYRNDNDNNKDNDNETPFIFDETISSDVIDEIIEEGKL